MTHGWPLAIADIGFLVACFLGVYCLWLMAERIILKHACIVAKEAMGAAKWFDLTVLIWLVASTYNCWYIFIQGF